jgi:hypothetical protein
MSGHQTRLIYSSPNGDTWFLCRESASGRAFVRHRANPSSGGHETDSDIDDFLSRGPHNPEHEALLRLIEDGVAPEPQAVRADRRSGTGSTSERPIAGDEDALRAEIVALQEDLSAAVAALGEASRVLHRLREEVETRSGGMTSPEHHQTFAAAAEQISRGIIALHERALAAEAKLRDRT